MELTPQEKLRRVVDKIVGLPTLPDMLSSLNRMMLNPRTSAKEVAQLISNDPAITSKILRVVNASFYGFPQRITTITHAIVILGFNTIRSIVLSSTIFDAFKGGRQRPDGFDRVQFWKHSIACGAAAKVLAKRLGISSIEELFIAGLLHDVGKIILDQYLHEQAQKVMDTVRQKDILWVKAEEEVMGVTHAELGGWLFQKWNLSKALVESCSCHHNPMLATDNLRAVSIVHFADILSRSLMVGSGGDRRIPMLSDTAWQAMDLPPGTLEKIVAETDEEIEKAFIFLDFLK